jgi:hypothetical protein
MELIRLPERAWAIASHRALVLRMEPVPVSTLRASIGYRKEQRIVGRK